MGIEYSTDLSENEAYERAVNLVLKDKRYDQAIPEFKSFIASFPESVYVANAHYWLGQLLFNKGNLLESARSFETVSDQFKASNKRGDALLKLGMIAQKQNNVEQAKQYYQQVLTEYPESASARL